MASEYKVYVSRIPQKWTKELMFEHFTTMGFGEVLDVEMFTSSKVRSKASTRGVGNLCFAFKNNGFCPNGDDCLYAHELPEQKEVENEKQSLGSGCVYFATKEGMNNALDQSSLHVSRCIVKISPFVSADDGRDATICYAWQKFNCTRGDDCKFSHDGPGSCVKVGEKYQGRKFQCMSFKKTGKCSKGDYCKFLHLLSEKAAEKMEQKNLGSGSRNEEIQKEEEEKADTVGASESVGGKRKQEEGKKGVCDNFKKKGKCRKGDRCPYSHVLSVTEAKKLAAAAEQEAKEAQETEKRCKRQRIDGSILVQKRAQNSKITFK